MDLTQPDFVRREGAADRARLIAAMVTPFVEDTGAVDRPSLTRLVAWLRAEGVDDLFVVGSTGELPLLDEPERLAVVGAAREAAGDGATIYAGVSGMGARHAARNAQAAHRAGADVAVLMSPFFVSLSQEQLVDYCVAVAEESPCPLVVYHHLRMATPFSVSALARLAEHPNIVGIKDTNGGDYDRCAEILAATAAARARRNGRGEFRFYQGVEKLVLPSLQAGAHGCVVAQACIVPGLFRGLLDAWAAGDLSAAQARQEEITAVWRIFSQPGVRQSFFHFLRTLKLPLQRRGILASAACSLPGTRFDPEFDALVTGFLAEKLAPEDAARRE